MTKILGKKICEASDEDESDDASSDSADSPPKKVQARTVWFDSDYRSHVTLTRWTMDGRPPLHGNAVPFEDCRIRHRYWREMQILPLRELFRTTRRSCRTRNSRGASSSVSGNTNIVLEWPMKFARTIFPGEASSNTKPRRYPHTITNSPPMQTTNNFPEMWEHFHFPNSSHSSTQRTSLTSSPHDSAAPGCNLASICCALSRATAFSGATNCCNPSSKPKLVH